MKISIKIIILFIFLFSIEKSFASDRLEGKWLLQIENTNHEVITTMKIRFTNTKAQSCLQGDWLKVVVDSKNTTDQNFFPINDRLSYEINNDNLTLGRNEVCDLYLELSGKLDQSNIVGEYYSIGRPGQRLGYFSLKRITENRSN